VELGRRVKELELWAKKVNKYTEIGILKSVPLIVQSRKHFIV
jgi:hypothetical protein